MTSVRETFKIAANSFDNWLFCPGDSKITSAAKSGITTIGSIGLLYCLLSGANSLYNQKIDADSKNDFDRLDRSKSVVFSSVEDCVSKNFSLRNCECSWEKAKSTAALVKLSYDSEAAAAQNHQQYNVVHYKKRHRHLVGKVPITTYTNKIRYDPYITSWQATQDDICDISIPLYSGPRANTYVRSNRSLLEIK